MLHKKQYITLALIALYTSTVQTMQQQQVGSLSSASFSITLSAPASSTSPYEEMSVEKLTFRKKELSTQIESLGSRIAHKIDHEWPKQNPCSNCLVGKNAQSACPCFLLSAGATMALIVLCPVSRPPMPFDISPDTCALGASVLIPMSVLHLLWAPSKHAEATRIFTQTERTEKRTLEKELSSVGSILKSKLKTIETIEEAKEKEDNRIWDEYRRKTIDEMKSKTE